MRAIILTVSFFKKLLFVFLVGTALQAQESNPRKVPTVKLVNPKKLLFLPFYNEAGERNYLWLETAIGQAIHEAGRKKYQYIKVEDQDFAAYFINKGYSVGDLYDFEKITKIAHDLGVDGVIYGNFRSDENKTHIIVTGKILSVIDREIIAEKTISMPVSAEMFSAVEEVSLALGDQIRNLFYPSNNGALARAAMLPGWGHRYKQHPRWAYFWGGLFWSSVVVTVISGAQYLRYSIEYRNYSPEVFREADGGTGFRDQTAAEAEFSRYRSNIGLWGGMTLGGLISIVVIYSANLLHAYKIAPNVVENPDLAAEQKGARLRFEMQPGNVGAYGLARGENLMNISLIWKF